MKRCTLLGEDGQLPAVLRDHDRRLELGRVLGQVDGEPEEGQRRHAQGPEGHARRGSASEPSAATTANDLARCPRSA